MRPADAGCRGAPRDLGYDQGRAARERVRAEVRAVAGPAPVAWWRRLRPDARVTGVERAAARFFPHMAERGAGLARGAGVARRHVAALLARELRADSSSLLGVSPERTGQGALVVRTLPPSSSILERTSAPDADWRSVEVTRPWLVPALAGVNERGLAVAASVVGGEIPTRGVEGAPALLLVQDCLQRFDTVGKAMDWCARRPAAGAAAILLADAAGEVAAVWLDEQTRRVERPADGLWVGPAPLRERTALDKACAAFRRLDPEALLSVLDPTEGAVVLDPAGARLGVHRPGTQALRWLRPPSPGA